MNKTAQDKKNKESRVSYGAAFRTGESHLKYPLGYQDAQYTVYEDDIFVSILCDGCSTTDDNFTKNQVGAVLGAEVIGRQLFKKIKSYERAKTFPFEKILSQTSDSSYKFFSDIIKKLERDKLGIDKRKFIEEKFLFTVVGFVIVKENYWFLGCGDGCFGVNQSRFVYDGTNGNRYFLQNLFNENRPAEFSIPKNGIIKNGDIYWLATDGLLQLFHNEENETLFFNFLKDNLTGAWNGGKDQTIRAFRKMTQNLNNNFNDDVTIVVAKIN